MGLGILIQVTILVAYLASELSYQLKLSRLQGESAFVVTPVCIVDFILCGSFIFLYICFFYIFLISIKVLYISSLNTENFRCVCIWNSRQRQEVQSQGLWGRGREPARVALWCPHLCSNHTHLLSCTVNKYISKQMFSRKKMLCLIMCFSLIFTKARNLVL